MFSNFQASWSSIGTSAFIYLYDKRNQGSYFWALDIISVSLTLMMFLIRVTRTDTIPHSPEQSLKCENFNTNKSDALKYEIEGMSNFGSMISLFTRLACDGRTKAKFVPTSGREKAVSNDELARHEYTYSIQNRSSRSDIRSHKKTNNTKKKKNVTLLLSNRVKVIGTHILIPYIG